MIGNRKHDESFIYNLEEIFRVSEAYLLKWSFAVGIDEFSWVLQENFILLAVLEEILVALKKRRFHIKKDNLRVNWKKFGNWKLESEIRSYFKLRLLIERRMLDDHRGNLWFRVDAGELHIQKYLVKRKVLAEE